MLAKIDLFVNNMTAWNWGVTDPDVCCSDGKSPSFMLHTLSQQGGHLPPGTMTWNMAALGTVNASLFEWLRGYFPKPNSSNLTKPRGSVARTCTSSRECSNAGRCAAGTCVCVTGFTGDHCQVLSMESYKCGNGGLCLGNGSTTWGGSVVLGDDSSHHMFAAMMTANKTLQAWLTNSVVLHAVAPAGSPGGPYEAADVALAPRPVPNFDSIMIHNPDAHRAPDGTFLIFYDGSSAPPPNQTYDSPDITGKSDKYTFLPARNK